MSGTHGARGRVRAAPSLASREDQFWRLLAEQRMIAVIVSLLFGGAKKLDTGGY